MLPPARSAQTEAFYDLTELKKAKFQLFCDKRRHYWGLKKASLIFYVLSDHWQTIWGGGGREAGLLGGKLPPCLPQ